MNTTPSIFSWFTLILWLILILFWLISAVGAKKTVQRSAWWRREIGIRLVLVIIIFILLRVGVFDHFSWTVLGGWTGIVEPYFVMILGIIGAILCTAGVAFAIWARVSLGRNWGMPMTLKENQNFISRGPYAYVRHPIYAGFLLAMFGAIFANGPVWLIIFAFAITYFIYSAKTEEKMMQKQFPDEYPAYMRRTKMLIPFIW